MYNLEPRASCLLICKISEENILLLYNIRKAKCPGGKVPVYMHCLSCFS